MPGTHLLAFDLVSSSRKPPTTRSPPGRSTAVSTGTAATATAHSSSRASTSTASGQSTGTVAVAY